MLRERRIASDQLRGGDKVQSSRGQRWHMQRLANVASGLRTTRVMVEQAAARREIQQNGTSQHGYRAPHTGPSENGPTRLHDLPASVTPLTRQPAEWVQKVDPCPVRFLDPATIPS